MEIKKILQEHLEGNLDGTSPSLEGEEPNEEIGLNNTTQPTLEEEEDAGIENEATQEPISEDGSDPTLEELSNELPNQEQGLNEDIESDIPQAQDDTALDDEVGIAETAATEPTFTQSQVDEIAGKVRKETREKVTKDFFQRYGVNSADELDDLFGDAQRFITAKDDFDAERKSWTEADAARENELRELRESVALLSSGIDRNRYEDAKFILKGKGLDVTVENIEAELATHPEWKEQAKQEPPLVTEAEGQQMPFRRIAQPQEAPHNPKPATTLNVLGNEASPQAKAPELSDYEKAMKMFKV